MRPHSITVQGYSCFDENPVDLAASPLIKVVIGKNNSGKSRFLGLVELLTKKELNKTGFTKTLCEAKFDVGFLKSVFSDRMRGGNLGYSHSNDSHWDLHGPYLIGNSVSWSLDSHGKPTETQFSWDPKERIHASHAKARREAVARHISSASKSILHGKVFRQILADRDIQPEMETADLELSRSGNGATNIIRRFITSVEFNEDRIQVDLRNALNEIFGEDGDFHRIAIQHHDGQIEDPESTFWEVFLGEPSKGLVGLSQSGSGLKTVILVLLNLLIVPLVEGKDVSQYIFAFEELENNLHPSLLRRLFRFLSNFVIHHQCQLYLTTHSSVALDFFTSMSDAQIIRVSHDGDTATAVSVADHFARVALVNELGARASDILQANGIVWLEGPSDRIYLNRLIELFSDGKLREGRDYQCAFYGGAILSRTEFSSPEEAKNAFANLLMLNSNIAVLCDGDRTKQGKGSRLKKRVQRIKTQVEDIPGSYLWITEAKEIENYVPGVVWKSVYSTKQKVPDPGKYDRFPTEKLEQNNTFVYSNLGYKSFDKCDFATAAAPHLTRENLESRFELAMKMQELVLAIENWNI